MKHADTVPTKRTPIAIFLAIVAAFAVAIGATSLIQAPDAHASRVAHVGNAVNSHTNITVQSIVTAPQVCTTGPKKKCTLKPGTYQHVIKPGGSTNGKGLGGEVVVGTLTRVYLPKGCQRWASNSTQTINPGWNAISTKATYVTFRVWGCK